MTISKTIENFVQAFIASWIIAYALLSIKEHPDSTGDWMMLVMGVLIVLQANWSYRRRKARESEQ